MQEAQVFSEEMMKQFSWQDYAVFAAMLFVSAAIGVYHGCTFGKKKKDPEADASGEFLTGNGQMRTIPVALSMLASFLSSITLMGQPAEVYLFGPQLWILGAATFLAVPLVSYVFVPFFRSLNVTSAFEYYGRRFNRKFQLFASSIFTVQMLLFLALVLYAPALALHQVTGINTEVVVIVMYLVCIFYTTVGGMKAVVWTDTFQVIVLYGAMVAVLVKGTMDVGGWDIVWQRNVDHQRGNLFDISLDPTKRYTLWGSLIGAAFLHMSMLCGNQLQIQRYMTVQSNKEARKMLWINAVGWTVVVILTAYAGMLIFAKYYMCDPLGNNEITTPDQLFPLFVMDVLGEYSGFPGLFVAGIFSAGLSTVSTGVNSLAAIWFAEMEGTEFKSKLSPQKAGRMVKILAFVFGLSSFALVFVVPYLGTLTPIAISLNSFFSGSLFGVFLLGMYFPSANVWGAFGGLTAGVGVVGWLTVGVQFSIDNGYQVFEKLPVSTDGCTAFNETLAAITTTLPEPEPAFILYRISFLWYSLISTVLTVVVGLAVSWLAHCCSSSPHIHGVSKDQAFSLLPRRLTKTISPNVFVPEGKATELKLLGEQNQNVRIV